MLGVKFSTNSDDYEGCIAAVCFRRQTREGRAMREIRGKKALITGAASGIGRAVTLRLAEEGCHLYVLDIDMPGLVETAAKARRFSAEVIAARCDVSRSDEITASNEAMLSRWGALDILVNNAGVAYSGPTENMTAQQWQWLLSINLLAPIQFVQELLPVLREQPESHIVTIASIFGVVAFGRFTAYNVSKFGLVGLSESLRAEYGRQGMGVSTICPGFVSTRLFNSASSGYPDGRKPAPPRLLCTSPQRVADKVVRAIYRDRRLTLVSPMASLLYYVNRFAPSLIDLVNRVGRRRRIAKKARQPQHAGGPVILPIEQPTRRFRKAA
jgi:NAD(P)-dependent dehydrogenase (short-subunit alcohol dehydrogenase family)